MIALHRRGSGSRRRGRPPPGRNTRSIRRGLLIAFLPLLSSAAVAEPPALLFDRHEILELTIEAPLGELARRPESAADLAATLSWSGGGEVLPVRLATYGKSRLQSCQLPPLELSASSEQAEGTPFAGLSTMRLVTHCRHDPGYERGVLLEYLAYRAWAVVAEPALRVRLARVRYVDPEGRGGHTHLAFFVEDIGDAAERAGYIWSDVASQRRAELEPTRAAVHALFQYMIANTDWSVLSGPPGERCCHNTALLEDPAGGPRRLLPYDFDSSGLVDAPHAAPSRTMGVSRVTQRVYRGFCDHNAALPEAIELLRRHRGELEALFLDDSLPNPPARRKAWRYLDGFYALVDNPAKREKRISDSCRVPTGG